MPPTARVRSVLRSNVVGLVALFVALGGVAMASQTAPKNSIVSRSIKNGQVKRPDLAKSSVTGAKIKDGSVTGADVNGPTLTGVRPSGSAGGGLSGTYPNPTIANDAVGSSQVINGSVGVGDLSFDPATQAELNASKPIVTTGGSLATTAIGPTCTSYADSGLTVDAPSAGTVVLSANAWLQTFHTGTNTDEINVAIGTTPTDCAATAGFATKYSIPSTEPALNSQDITIPVSRVVQVSAGSHTFYMNGFMSSGADTENFFAEGMTAVFYPN